MLARKLIAKVVESSGGGDTQTVTTGISGLNPDRLRGYQSATSTGSITDGTSNIYSGAAITRLIWDEGSSVYELNITGATNSGWSTLTIDGTKVLTRTSATFSAGGIWVWITGDNITTQAFGTNGTSHTCVFA